jgi:hypothetical protein
MTSSIYTITHKQTGRADGHMNLTEYEFAIQKVLAERYAWSAEMLNRFEGYINLHSRVYLKRPLAAE